MSMKAEMGSACGDCGAVDRLLIHQVRHRGTFRRLCTSCVLRLHPQSFCPSCFEMYPPPPPNDALVTCSKCYSSSHSHCIGGPTPPPNPYICPLCVSPNSSIFNLMKDDADDSSRLMDRDSAKKLLAAAKIASSSMNRAAVAAKAEAERRAREAAVAKKRAKDALQHVAFTVMKENLSNREAPVLVGHPNPHPHHQAGGFNMSRVKVENNHHPSVPPLVAVAADRDTSNSNHHNQVLAALRRRKTGMTTMMAAAAAARDEELIANGTTDDIHDELFADMEVDTKQDDEDDDDDDQRHEAILDNKMNGNNNYEDQHDADDDDEEEDDDDDDEDDDDNNNEDDDAM